MTFQALSRINFPIIEPAPFFQSLAPSGSFQSTQATRHSSANNPLYSRTLAYPTPDSPTTSQSFPDEHPVDLSCTLKALREKKDPPELCLQPRLPGRFCRC